MASAPITTEDPRAAVDEWFELLTKYCSSVDYESAHQIFDDAVASFGTFADAVRGLENVQREQWENVWPKTKGFHVLMDTVHGGGEGDLAWGMGIWESIGYDASGAEFLRRGRATVVIARSNGRWAAVHTHFSLFRDKTQTA